MLSFKLALRTLRRAPVVTAVAVASLALGIGANTAIFSLIQAVLLRKLPVSAPEGLVNILAQSPNPGSQTCNQAGSCRVVFSYPMFRDLERGQTVLSGLAAHRIIGADLAIRGKALSGLGMAVSGGYFGTLGLAPALGRLLGPADDLSQGGSPVAVLSHRFWTTDLGADPGVLNQTLLVNGIAMTIVGVAPAGFEGTTLGSRARVFVPLTMITTLGFQDCGGGSTSSGCKAIFEGRTSYWVYLFGRLKPGVSLEQARAGLNSVYRPIITNMEVQLQTGITAEMLARFKAKQVDVAPGDQGQNQIQGQTRTPLLLLIGVTAIVLLVACTNVANLLLVRAAGRQGEMAVRSSLGAQRGQLISQLMLESAVITVLAGGLSVVVAQSTLGLIMSFLPQELTRSVDVGLDRPVLLFAAALSIATTFLFGLLPALQATRQDLLAAIQAGGTRGSADRGAARFRSGLVTAQIALSMALLCSAGLFVRSLMNVNRVNLGLKTENVVTFALSPGQMGYTRAQQAALFRRVEETLAAVPGIVSVSSATVPILLGWSNGGDVDVEGFKTTPEADVNARVNQVGPGYFTMLGIPVLSGREFRASDQIGTAPVVVVNEAFVNKFGLGPDALGKRVTEGNALVRRADDHPQVYQIVGVVRNAAYDQVKEDAPQPMLFSAHRQDSTTGRVVFYARTSIDPSAIVRAVPPLVAGIDPNLPVAELTTLSHTVRENIYLDRMITSLSAAFAVLATLLAAVGLYGVLAYNVTLRRREIGVRMALGADAGRVQALVVRQVGLMVAVGGAIGIVAAFGIGRMAQSVLFGLAGYDLPAFTLAAIAITAVSLAAGYAPARKASRIHPTQALRGD